VIVIPLLVAEVGLRLVEPRVSEDVATILEMPEVGVAMRDSEDPAILVLGNSYVRRGILGPQLERRLSDGLSGGAGVYMALADATTSAEWPWMLKHDFLDRGAVPDVIVLGILSHLIDDSADMRADRVGGYFSDWSDTGELFREDVTRLDARATLVLSHVSASFRNREAVKQRVLRNTIPGYERFRKELNAALKQQKAPEPGAEVEMSFRRLTKLVTLAREHGTAVVLVALPRNPPARFSFDPGERAALTELGIELIDLRDGDWVTTDLFMDESHLNPWGGERCTDALAGPLLEVLTRVRPDRFTRSRP